MPRPGRDKRQRCRGHPAKTDFSAQEPHGEAEGSHSFEMTGAAERSKEGNQKPVPPTPSPPGSATQRLHCILGGANVQPGGCV